MFDAFPPRRRARCVARSLVSSCGKCGTLGGLVEGRAGGEAVREDCVHVDGADADDVRHCGWECGVRIVGGRRGCWCWGVCTAAEAYDIICGDKLRLISVKSPNACAHFLNRLSV